MRLLEIGRITKTRGLMGTLKVASFLTGSGALLFLREVFLLRLSPENHRKLNGLVFAEPELMCQVAIKKLFPSHRGTSFHVDFQDVDTIEKAMPLVGCHLLIPPEQLPPLPEGEYYWWEVLGMRVFSPAGKFLGVIAEIFSTGSNDVYVCRSSEQELLLPATASCIISMNLAEGIMVADYNEVSEDAF